MLRRSQKISRHRRTGVCSSDPPGLALAHAKLDNPSGVRSQPGQHGVGERVRVFCRVNDRRRRLDGRRLWRWRRNALSEPLTHVAQQFLIQARGARSGCEIRSAPGDESSVATRAAAAASIIAQMLSRRSPYYMPKGRRRSGSPRTGVRSGCAWQVPPGRSGPEQRDVLVKTMTSRNV